MKLKKLEISERVVQRLTEYLSILKEARKRDDEINSIELAKIMNTTSAQVRKDLSTFGEFGVRGKGYDIDNLIEIITKIGKIAENDLVIQDVRNVEEFIKNMKNEFNIKIDTAILAVIKEQAQFAAEELVKNGICAILNMTTYKLELNENIKVVDMDISAKLQELNFWRINSPNEKI